MMDWLGPILMPVWSVAAVATAPAAIELLLVTTGALRKPKPAAVVSLDGFRLAVIVPAHNEEVLIGRCVESLLASAAAGVACEVIVVADNCTDSTAERAQAAGARVLVRTDAVLRGKGYALRYAIDRLMAESFDGFLIVDADSIISPNLAPEIACRLKGGADAVQARYRVTQPLDTKRKRLMDVALLAFNVLRPRGRAGWGLSAGILGNGFALSRRTLAEVPYSADSIVEDLEYHLLLVEAHKRVEFADLATVYGDMPNDAAAQKSQRARWEGGRARVARAWIPKLMARLLKGNLAAAEPLWELLTLPLAYLALLALMLCAAPLAGQAYGFAYYGVFLIGLLLAHIGVAVALGGNVKESLGALMTAPAYVFWKLTSLGAIIQSSRPDTQWLRTARASDAKEEAPRV